MLSLLGKDPPDNIDDKAFLLKPHSNNICFMTTFCSLERSFIRLAISLELYTKITPNKKQFAQNPKTLVLHIDIPKTLGYNIDNKLFNNIICYY